MKGIGSNAYRTISSAQRARVRHRVTIGDDRNECGKRSKGDGQLGELAEGTNVDGIHEPKTKLRRPEEKASMSNANER